jgi:ParB family chromosome partitioning protein
VNIIQDIGIEQLKRNPDQPRKHFAQAKLQELAKTIREFGIIQPLVVKKLSSREFEIIAGERRWRAAQLAPLETVPCLIQDVNDTQKAAMALIENLQREPLNPIEEAHAFHQFMLEFDLTQESLAEKLGCTRSKVAHSLRLLKCHSKVKEFIIDGLLTEGHGKVLAGLTEPQQLQLVHECCSLDWSVRQLERAVRNIDKRDSISLSIKKDPDVEKLLQRISEQLGTEVQLIPDKKGGGWMKVRYFNNDTLSGVLARLGII